MTPEENRKRIERQARSLILSKDISVGDREKINSLMRNQVMPFEERYGEIIRILKSSPDKEVAEIADETSAVPEIKKSITNRRVTSNIRKPAVQPQGDKRKYPDINGPTETKLFIDDIYYRFRRLKLFKKRYLVRRPNRFGIGWSKHLIPAKKFLQLMYEIRSFQETLLSRLPQILERILKDESVESPLEFNYLRMLRRWMVISPLSAAPYDRIKWMEQWDFEREFRQYTVYFHTFMRIDTGVRELILNMAERYLREEPDLAREELSGEEERSEKARKENENYRKEKYIYEYMGALRSFIAIPGEADSLVSSFLKKSYGISTLEEAINTAVEALVFQRPFTSSELREYFEITPPSVSAEVWDLSAARLEVYGKDPVSIRRRHIEKLERDLLWFETVYQIVKIEENGRNILISAVEELWKYVDRINRDPEETRKENFIVFLEGIVHYFEKLMVPILNGGQLSFDYYGDQIDGALFTRDFFSEEISEVERVAASIFNFRNQNPTLKVTEEEVKKIAAGRITSMSHVEGIVFKTGSSFYAIGKKLHEVYHRHLGSSEKDEKRALRTSPVGFSETDDSVLIPYSRCVFSGFEPSTPLLRKIAGRKILSDSMKGGIVIFILAYCYQAAYLCGYPQIKNEISRRDILKREISELKSEGRDA